MAVSVLLTNSTHWSLGVCSEEADNLGLVGRGTTTAHHCRTLAGQLDKLTLIVLQTQLREGGREGEEERKCQLRLGAASIH